MMMKKLFSLILLAALACLPALAEEPSEEKLSDDDTATFIHELYESDVDDTYNVSTDLTVKFDELFTLTIPADWQRYNLTEQQAEQGMIVCYGDGRHFMFIGRRDDDGAYADMQEYAMTLGMGDQPYASIFVSQFGGQDFTLYTDYKMMSSDCATIFPGKYVYTFYFYPADGDMTFAQTVIDLMNTFKPMQTK